MALGETERAQKLTRSALAVQPDLTVGYVRAQEWYRDRAILNTLVNRLLAAGVPDGDDKDSASGCALPRSTVASAE